MSFTVQGQAYEPKSAAEHALEALSAINTDRATRGESALIASPTNAIWLMCLAIGNMRADYDLQMAACQQSFSLSYCNDQQVLNLLPVAGVERIPATFGKVALTVVATSGGSCVVPAGTVAIVTGLNVTFVTDSALTVAAAGTGTVNATCNTAGAIQVVAGQIAAFSGSIANLASVSNLKAAAAGTNIETPNQVRRRLLVGDIFGVGVDGVRRALLAVTGIIDAKVFFNTSNTDTLTLEGGDTVAPRSVRMYVLGSDASGTGIALAYIQRMSAPTVGALTQNWTTGSGQGFLVKYSTVTSSNLYVRLTYASAFAADPNWLVEAQNLVMGLVVMIGETITTDDILSLLAGFALARIITAEVSLTGTTWSNKVIIAANKYPTLSRDRITAVAG